MNFSETKYLEVNTMTQTLSNDPTVSNWQADSSKPTWYEQFLEDYDYESPKGGQVLKGKILRIDEDAILIDVGLKRDAIVPSRDLNNLPEEVLSDLNVGDAITVYVLKSPVGDQDLLVSINKGIEFANWELAEKYLKSEEVLELEIVGKNRGGLLVDFENLRGFLPYSQVPELRRNRDQHASEEIKHQLISSRLPMKVIEVDQSRQRLIFSVQAAQETLRNQRLEELEVGQILSGPVVNIVKFGVFVDLDGIDGLVHISKLDWKRIRHPSEVVKLGDELRVKVIDIDKEKERISLDRKALMPSPWDNFRESHADGETLEGEITNIVDFGAFVRLEEGVEGLVHISEVGYSSTGNPLESIRRGEKVLVRILEIDPLRERASLSMRQVPLEKQLAWSLENPPEKPVKEPESEPETALTAPAGEEADPVVEVTQPATELVAEQAEPAERSDPEVQIEHEEVEPSPVE